MGIQHLKMHRFRLVSLGLAALIAAAPVYSATAQSPDTQTIADRKGRFTIDFPGDWEVASQESGMPSMIGVAPGTAGEFRPSVNVVVEDLPRLMSANTYADLNEKTLSAVFRDFKVLEQGPITIGSQPAYSRIFTWLPNSGHALYQMQVYLTVGQVGFVVTGTTVNDPDYIRRDMPAIARIIATFRPTITTLHASRLARGATLLPVW
ncbi:MAG TPA: DcrB-related protein [bacterium]|nr:DcrB-related protein [bacterium]